MRISAPRNAAPCRLDYFKRLFFDRHLAGVAAALRGPQGGNEGRIHVSSAGPMTVNGRDGEGAGGPHEAREGQKTAAERVPGAYTILVPRTGITDPSDNQDSLRKSQGAVRSRLLGTFVAKVKGGDRGLRVRVFFFAAGAGRRRVLESASETSGPKGPPCLTIVQGPRTDSGLDVGLRRPVEPRAACRRPEKAADWDVVRRPIRRRIPAGEKPRESAAGADEGVDSGRRGPSRQRRSSSRESLQGRRREKILRRELALAEEASQARWAVRIEGPGSGMLPPCCAGEGTFRRRTAIPRRRASRCRQLWPAV
jgi:hypothetical protein